MEIHYLIDFENVHEDGLDGIGALGRECFVHLMYTQNAPKLSLDVFSGYLRPTLEVIKTASGRQSLDMHLISYLGYLIGCEKDADTRYVIISSDNGFAGTAAFWNVRMGMEDKVRQQSSISGKVPGENKSAKPARRATRRTGSVRSAVKKAEEPAAPAPAAEELPVVTVPAVEPAPVEETAAPVTEQITAETPAAEAVPETPAEEKQPAKKNGAKPKREGRKAEKKPAAPQNDKSRINNDIQSILSKNKYETDSISFVASTAVKFCGQPKSSQLVYREIIKKFGQKEGLKVYNLVKPVLQAPKAEKAES